MNQPHVSVSISAIAFEVENVAYSRLNSYLEILGRHHLRTPDPDYDPTVVEERIAQQLACRPLSTSSVVTDDEIRALIAQIGFPRTATAREKSQCHYATPGVDQPGASRSIGPLLASFFSLLGAGFRVVIACLAGLVIFVHSILLIALVVAGVVILTTFFDSSSFLLHSNPYVMVISVLLVLGLPMVLLIYLCARCIRRFRLSGLFIILTSALWFVSLITSGVCTIKEATQRCANYFVETNEQFSLPSDTLYVGHLDEPVVDSHWLIQYILDDKLDARIRIRRSDEQPDSTISVKIKKSSNGVTQASANSQAVAIPYAYALKRDSLALAQGSTIDWSRSTYDGQQVNVEIIVPRTMTVEIDPHAKHNIRWSKKEM